MTTAKSVLSYTMLNLDKRVKSFMLKAGQSVPSEIVVPTKEQRLLSCRLLLEEVLEYIEAAGFTVLNCNHEIDMNETFFIENLEVNPVEMIDAIGDTMFVAQGRAAEMGINLEEFLEEICDSNDSKFIGGYKDPETGKWKKGPGFREPDITGILQKQIEKQDKKLKEEENQLKFGF